MTEESKELTPLEEEFKKAVETALPLIDEQIAIARKAISKAEKIAEEYGVPFSSDITPLSMGFRPESFSKKFSSLDENRVYDLFEEFEVYIPEYEGWEHSQVC